MKINKDRTAVYSKVYAGLLAMVPEDIFNAEDCIDFKLGVGKAMAIAIEWQRHMTENEQGIAEAVLMKYCMGIGSS